MKNKILAITILFNTFFCVRAFAQITLISTLNPASTGDVCGLAYDADSSFLWSYGCNALEIQSYDTLGNLVISFPLPGGGANDVDLEFAPEPFKINGIEYPKGQLLLINGEVGAAEIYVIDNLTGEALDTLITAFGASHVVGGAYHHIRKTFFLVQDNVPSGNQANRIAEIDLNTGDTIQSFSIPEATNNYEVSYGDIDIGPTGNIFVVSSIRDSMVEFTPTGSLVQMHGLPATVGNLSSIAIDCFSGEAWVGDKSTGNLYRLGNFPFGGSPCSTVVDIDEIKPQSFYLSDVFPNPFNSEFSFSMHFNQTEKINISIYNLMGVEVKQIFEGTISQGKKDFSVQENTLANGVYILSVQTEEFAISKRIVCIE
ncbi:MAG: T9SS type A sorting domain-containing protein [Chitinophagales bacterium]|nr:T9SS type A sorting domain-containing protein [Chitinophagales bacterium]MBP9189719.1 T9SS type A sorting domain-containing protein [Chitinophagales bacterium]